MESNKTIKILIPNATSSKNIGDASILEMLIEVVKHNFINSFLTVHSTDYQDHNIVDVKKMHSTLYEWAVFEDRNFVTRIFRLINLLFYYLILRVYKEAKLSGTAGELINDYREADLIIFTGGGYLRSKSGVTQSLNLIMQLVIFKFATLFNSKVVVAPMSFGPFKHSWQEKISAKVLSKVNTVLVREKYSYDLIKKYPEVNAKLSYDLALLFNDSGQTKENGEFTIGFTSRNWLDNQAQDKFEDNMAHSLKDFSNKTGAKIQPIVQVNAAEFGEDDLAVTKRIANKLNDLKANILPLILIEDVNHARSVYKNLNMLLGMRMHSNIIAATQGTPFVSISYEHKTEGIADDLGVKELSIKCEEASREELLKLMMNLYNNKNIFSEKIKLAHEKIISSLSSDFSMLFRRALSDKKLDV